MSTDKTHSAMAPAVDIYESEDEYLILSDLPGADPASLSLDLDHGQLTLAATRLALGGEVVHGSEPSSFHRVFRLPDSIDAEAVSARLDKGVLEVHLPKREALKPRRIPVHTG